MKKIISLCLLALFVSTSSFAKDFDPDKYLNTEYKLPDDDLKKSQQMADMVNANIQRLNADKEKRKKNQNK